MLMHFAVDFVRSIVGVLLIWAGISKIRDLKQFTYVVRRFALLPKPLVVMFAYCIPVAELFAGTGLLLPLGELSAAVIAAGLFWMFGAAISINMAKGNLDVPCGCFGSRMGRLSLGDAARAYILAIAATGLAVLQFINPGPTGSPAVYHPEVIAVAATALACVAAVSKAFRYAAGRTVVADQLSPGQGL